MSLDVSGFDKMVTGGAVTIAVADNHRLVKLAQKLPWDEMIKIAIPDLQRTEKKTLVDGQAFTNSHSFRCLCVTADV